jgi:hypothetical protein
MSLLIAPFTFHVPFKGAGSILSAPFSMFYPAEVGCFAAPSTTALPPEPVHLVTDYARALRARAFGDGTAFKVTSMAIGVGGHDPVDVYRPTPINPVLQTLVAETYRTSNLVRENPREDGRGASYAAPLSREAYAGGISEAGLIATILWSPVVSEIGTEFLYSVVHFPLTVKTTRHVETIRILELV